VVIGLESSNPVKTKPSLFEAQPKAVKRAGSLQLGPFGKKGPPHLRNCESRAFAPNAPTALGCCGGAFRSRHKQTMKDLTLIIENVRTFRGRHEIPIRPLTILTGENSSGKTTLLAMFSALCDLRSYPLRPDFNPRPYNLGNYETIASLDTTGDGWAPHFSLGFQRSDSDSERIKHAEARYVSERGQIRLNNFTARGANFEFRVATKGGAADSLHGSATIGIDAKTLKVPFSNLRTDPAPLHLSNLVTNAVTQSLVKRLGESFDVFLDLSLNLLHLAPAAETSLAPIRSEPQRVYSQITEVFKPTGDHIPFSWTGCWKRTASHAKGNLFPKC
jgi:hypothetical protein